MKLRDSPLMTRKRGVKTWPPRWTTADQEKSDWPIGELGTLRQVWMHYLLPFPLRPSATTTPVGIARLAAANYLAAGGQHCFTTEVVLWTRRFGRSFRLFRWNVPPPPFSVFNNLLRLQPLPERENWHASC